MVYLGCPHERWRNQMHVALAVSVIATLCVVLNRRRHRSYVPHSAEQRAVLGQVVAQPKPKGLPLQTELVSTEWVRVLSREEAAVLPPRNKPDSEPRWRSAQPQHPTRVYKHGELLNVRVMDDEQVVTAGVA